MKIVDPLFIPYLLFLGTGMFVLVFGPNVSGLVRVVLLILVFAIIFGSIISIQGRKTTEENDIA